MITNSSNIIMNHQPIISIPQPPSPPRPRAKGVGATTGSGTNYSTHPVHKTLASAANLANLLPTGTVLVFQTLTPSFSNKGICQISNKCLTSSLIAFCAIICFLSSFTDSFTDAQGKLYYGIATFKGLYIFNNTTNDGDGNDDEEKIPQEILEKNDDHDHDHVDLTKFKIRLIDFVHAFVSLFVFLAFAFSDDDVQNCFFPFGGSNLDVLVMNLPLAAGIFSSFFFMIFPTTRRGIGYGDTPSKVKY